MDNIIEQRKEYMKQYYLKNKDRYQDGNYIRKTKENPRFYIRREPVTIRFR